MFHVNRITFIAIITLINLFFRQLAFRRISLETLTKDSYPSSSASDQNPIEVDG
jgi:hypothetical protein